MRTAMLAPLLLGIVASPAFAQDHQHGEHSGHGAAEGARTEQPDEAEAGAGESSMDHSQMDHAQMDHSEMGHGPVETPEPLQSHQGMDHTTMDHSQMDHAAMGHEVAEVEEEIPQTSPPPAAFEGPTFAADAFVGTEKMAASRASVTREVSGMPIFWFQADRAEYRARTGGDGYLWDVQGFYGGDIDKFWFKSEGEGSFGEKPEDVELQGLWSHAVDPWWDLQAGVRQDLAGPNRTHAVVGIQGLAPYLFEVDAAAFLSIEGDLTARVEAELDQRLTQRLILQPRAELNLSGQDIPELGVGAGFDKTEVGLRLRYEFSREFAPYVGIEQEWKHGHSADYARAAGEDPSVTSYVVGIRFWF